MAFIMKKITIKDVAYEAGVSVGTASMALNDKAGVSIASKEKVIQTAKNMGFKPNKHAKMLIAKRTQIIGLMVTDITNPFFGLIISFIQHFLDDKGYELMPGISGGSVTKEKSIIDRFISLRVDAVIAVPSHKPVTDLSHYKELQDNEIPFCFITTYYKELSAPCVMTDLSLGSYWLTKHLLQNEHRVIVYIVANISLPLAALRVDGYQTAYNEAGFAFNPDWIVMTNDASFEGGYNATKELLSQIKPDAILAMNDIMALGVLKYLRENGYLVPNDISVAGYDNLIYTTLLETPLTTVEQPVEEICRKAVETVISKINNPSFTNEKIFLSPELIIRESTKII